MDELSGAISFVNNYFALVDGLASGLEDHLAEDVILDWFGRSVKGKKSVTAFIKAHKVNSRHMFSEIIPTTNIGYTKNINRKKKNAVRFEGEGNDTNNAHLKQEVSEINNNQAPDTVLEDSKTAMTLDDMTYDIKGLYKQEIKPTNMAEIEASINRIKLEEEVAPTIRAVKRECGQGDGPDVIETSAIKYVEAHGQIEFSRKTGKSGSWETFSGVSVNMGHTWRRSCKLQIAYSVCSTQRSSEIWSDQTEEILKPYAAPRRKLPTLQEIGQISNRLVANTNDFGGYLKDIDFAERRNEFLRDLEAEMCKGLIAPMLSARYVDNKLVLARPKREENRKQRGFVFNYLIHLIIYEGNNKCRVNLLRKFEKPT